MSGKLNPELSGFRTLELLVPEFRAKVEQLLANCKAAGVTMVPYDTLIGPLREAKLYCHSRTWAQVQPIATKMIQGGAPKLAALLKPEFCLGRTNEWKSNAQPGRSWHSRGLAVDCFWSVKGAASWDNNSAGNGYAVYASEAKKLGLTAGHFWAMRDSVHVQMPSAGGPNEPWSEVERLMLARFNF